MSGKIKDPMLLPLRDPKKREQELKLIEEFVKSGKVKHIDYKPVDSEQVTHGAELLEEIGTDDGNFRVLTINEVNENVGPKGSKE